MARKKELVPLTNIKSDFVAALDETMQCALNLYSAVDFIIKSGDLSPALTEALRKPNEALFAAMFEKNE